MRLKSRYFILGITVMCIVLIAGGSAPIFAQGQTESPADVYRTPPVWRPDGLQVASVNGLNVEIRDADTGLVQLTLVGHTDEISALAWSPQGDLLASGSYDQTARVWNANTGQSVHTFSNQTFYVPALVWSHQGDHLLSVNLEGSDIWEINSGALLDSHLAGAQYPTGASFSPDGTIFTSISTHIYIWRSDTFELFARFGNAREANNMMTTMEWSSTGDRIVTGSWNGAVYVWDVASQQYTHRLPGVPAYVGDDWINTPGGFGEVWIRDVSFNSEGTHVYSISSGGNVRGWNLATGQLIVDATIDAPVYAAAFSPDNSRLALVDDTGTLAVIATPTFPTANAGLDQTVTDSDGDGFAQVALDGSGSSDPDGTIVAYEWFEGSSLLASGVSPSAALPVGVHPLRLVVTDDDGLTAEDAVTVTINEPAFLDSCPDGDNSVNVIICNRLDTNGINAFNGDDTITIASGGDVRGVVTGESNRDTITVEAGGRVEGLVRGYQGDDTLILREGGYIRDGLDGDGYNDTFMVEASGGLTLVGDSGNDTFIFNGSLTGTYNVSGSSDSDTLDCRGLTFAVTVTSTGKAQGIVEGNGGQFRINYTGIQHVLTPP